MILGSSTPQENGHLKQLPFKLQFRTDDVFRFQSYVRAQRNGFPLLDRGLEGRFQHLGCFGFRRLGRGSLLSQDGIKSVHHVAVDKLGIALPERLESTQELGSSNLSVNGRDRADLAVNRVECLKKIFRDILVRGHWSVVRGHRPGSVRGQVSSWLTLKFPPAPAGS